MDPLSKSFRALLPLTLMLLVGWDLSGEGKRGKPLGMCSPLRQLLFLFSNDILCPVLAEAM